MSVTCDRSVVFSGYSGFLHQSGVKHYKPNQPINHPLWGLQNVVPNHKKVFCAFICSRQRSQYITRHFLSRNTHQGVALKGFWFSILCFLNSTSFTFATTILFFYYSNSFCLIRFVFFLVKLLKLVLSYTLSFSWYYTNSLLFWTFLFCFHDITPIVYCFQRFVLFPWHYYNSLLFSTFLFCFHVITTIVYCFQVCFLFPWHYTNNPLFSTFFFYFMTLQQQSIVFNTCFGFMTLQQQSIVFNTCFGFMTLQQQSIVFNALFWFHDITTTVYCFQHLFWFHDITTMVYCFQHLFFVLWYYNNNLYSTNLVLFMGSWQ